MYVGDEDVEVVDEVVPDSESMGTSSDDEGGGGAFTFIRLCSSVSARMRLTEESNASSVPTNVRDPESVTFIRWFNHCSSFVRDAYNHPTRVSSKEKGVAVGKSGGGGEYIPL